MYGKQLFLGTKSCISVTSSTFPTCFSVTFCGMLIPEKVPIIDVAGFSTSQQ